MPTFTLNLTNSTSSSWYFGIYQKYPDTVLDSVVWKVQGIPPNATSQIQWTEDYGTSLIQLRSNQIIGKQIVSSKLGSLYEVVTDGGVPSINPTPAGTSGAPDIISVQNKTSPTQKVNMGFALSGNILAVEKDVLANGISEFQVHPTYWVDIYSEIQVGTFVTATSTTDPKELAFPTGVYTMNAVASLDGDSIVLKISESQ